MTPHAETMLTRGLAALCLLLAFASRAPQLLVRHVPIEREQIDLTVSVQGEVGRPGVYRLPWGARVEDLLAAAGGMTPAAEPALVQLADPLSDGETVIVPGRRSTIGEGRVDVNSASVLELEQLPGVGPAIAAKIVAGRPYARIEDLLRVSGIGERTLERLRPLVTL